MYKWHKNQNGFTLMEMVIVIIIMALLAVGVIPQISAIGDDAKLNTLKANLNMFRKAIERYYVEHNSTYPGDKDIAANDADTEGAAKTAFKRQLVLYTSVDGVVSKTKDATHFLGPYIKREETKLPRNPFNGKKNIILDIATQDITQRTSDGTTGWKFYTKTGVFIANDGAHDNL